MKRAILSLSPPRQMTLTPTLLWTQQLPKNLSIRCIFVFPSPDRGCYFFPSCVVFFFPIPHLSVWKERTNGWKKCCKVKLWLFYCIHWQICSGENKKRIVAEWLSVADLTHNIQRCKRLSIYSKALQQNLHLSFFKSAFYTETLSARNIFPVAHTLYFSSDLPQNIFEPSLSSQHCIIHSWYHEGQCICL